MARLTFEPDEADQLRAEARAVALETPALAYALQQMADEGVDLDTCRTWEQIRAERGLPTDAAGAA